MCLACPSLRSCVRITADTMDDDEFPIEQKRAADRANTILQSAIAFADEVKVPEGMIVEVFRTVVAKHVDAQLHFLGERVSDYELSRIRAAFEKLAHAHATEGVRVKMTQPWHNDRDRDRDRD